MRQYKKYKESDNPIIGKIPSHWEIVRNKSVLSSHYEMVGLRKDIPLLSLTTEGVIIRDTTSGKGKFPKDFGKYNVVYPNQIIFCLFDVDETPRTVGLSHNYGMITNAYDTFNVNVLSNPDYICYFYIAIDNIKGLRPLYTGLRKVVQYNRFMQYKMLLPPKKEQDVIVSFLNEKTSAINSLVKLKMIEIEKTKEMIETMIYSSSTSNSVIINSWEHCFPNDWIVKSGRSLFEEITIKGISNERFLAVTQDRGLIYKDTNEVNFVTASQKETQKLVQPNQFVISLRSFEGGIEFSDKKGLVSPAYVIFKLREQYNTPLMQTYYRFLFKSVPFVRRLNTISDSLRDGKSIKFTDISNFLFPLPSETKLKEIMRLAKIYDIRRDALFKEKLLLEEYKQRLIADVVTGKINVQPE